MIDAVETLRNVDLEQVLGPKLDALEDRRDGIPTGTTWAEPVEVGRELRFPLGFQGLAPQRLSRPFMQGGNAKRPLCSRAAFGYPHASERGGFAIALELVGQP
jgi:hypothetical protein